MENIKIKIAVDSSRNYCISDLMHEWAEIYGASFRRSHFCEPILTISGTDYKCSHIHSIIQSGNADIVTLALVEA